MTKRARDNDQTPPPCPKRHQPDQTSPQTALALLSLPDEILLRILAHVAPDDLVRCLRVCRRFHKLAGDRQLWKLAYYSHFGRPRLVPASERSLDAMAMRRGPDREERPSVDWKQLFKLMSNWTRGSCLQRKLELHSKSSDPREGTVQVAMQNGLFITVDCLNGLRAWKDNIQGALFAALPFEQAAKETSRLLPSALAVDSSDPSLLQIVIGFTSGEILASVLSITDAEFSNLRTVKASPAVCSSVVAIATSWPYIFSVSGDRQLLLHEAVGNSVETLSSLQSNTIGTQLSLGFRSAGKQRTIATVAFTFEGFPVGWSIGIQELTIQHRTASLPPRIRSRTAVSPMVMYNPKRKSTLSMSLKNPRGDPLALQALMPRPTSISYVHPYMLLSHNDNTLTMLLVKSTELVLEIGSAIRLWGHSSAVLNAKVGPRGKAVSVSRQTRELRIWELEGLRSRSIRDRESVRVQAGDAYVNPSDQCHGLSFWDQVHGEWTASGWLGFDNEKVALLTESALADRALIVYDFS